MNSLKKHIIQYCLLLTLLFPLSTFANVEAPAQTKSINKNESYLFIQLASEGILKPLKNSPSMYQLKLIGVQPYVTYFTDRPNRITGLLATTKFLRIWKENFNNNFRQDAPNVGVSGIKFHGIFRKQDVDFVLVLSQPFYNAKNNTMTYLATALTNNKKALPIKPITFGNVALFFDDTGWCPSCCCG